MAAPITGLSVIIPEVLSKQIDVFAQTFSPLVAQTVESSNNVTKPEWGSTNYTGGSATWSVNKEFEIGVAGTVAWAPVPGQTDMIGSEPAIANAATATSRVNRYSSNAGAGLGRYPGIGWSTSQSWFKYSIGLARLVGNMSMPGEVVRAGNIALADPLARMVKGTAAHVAKQLCNAALNESYTDQTKPVRGVLGRVAVGTGTGEYSAGAAQVEAAVRTVTLTHGAIQRFVDGMHVDLWGLYGTTIYKLNGYANGSAYTPVGPVVVTNVNGFGNSIGLLNLTGASLRPDAIDGTHAITVLLITEPGAISGTTVDLSSTAPTQNIPWSFDDVLKKTGKIYGVDATYTGIDVANHPEFASIVEAVNGPIDENLLGQLAATWSYSRSPDSHIDTWVFSPGCYSAFLQNMNGVVVYEKNGEPITPALGYGKSRGAVATFEFEGRVFRFMCDPFMGKGVVYGLKLGEQNWKRYVPPRLKGTVQGMPGFISGIEFIAPMRGFSDIWEPVNYTDGNAGTTQPTDGVQAPFQYFVQYVADLVSGIKLTGVTENYATLT